jgi:tetratricopeptide (TPR) repeat protein
MNLINCYRLLGLPSGATPEEVKASYRNLARQYHPDINRGNREAQAHFIRLTEAYKFLISHLPKTPSFSQKPQQTSKPSSVTSPQKPQYQEISNLPDYEKQLKWNCYEKLQQLLREGRIIRAIALVEGLGQRLSHDPEVRQWQAITYQLRGKILIKEGELEKGKRFLEKAMRIDPHNKSLTTEIKKILREIDLSLRF